jgi:predicted RNase H-like HicB family nuclease
MTKRPGLVEDSDEHARLSAMARLVVELIPDPDEGGFTARVPDIPAYGEGETEDEAIADLKRALRGYIETFGLDDALSRINSPVLRHLDLELADLTGE